MSSPEVYNGGPKGPEIDNAAEQSAEKLKQQMENAGEKSPDRTGEKVDAGKEVEAAFSKEAGRERKSGGEPSGSPRSMSRVTKAQKKSKYKQTMKQTQSHLSAPSKAFSKAIHNPTVEKTSDAVGATIARPNAILFASVSAFILVGLLYLVAKYYGYQLSGFETMAAFIIGWILGLLFDYTSLMFKKSTR